MKNISQNGKRIFRELIVELARALKLWVKDHEAYYQEISRTNLIFTTIDTPPDLKDDILSREDNNEPYIQQLFHTRHSLNLTIELSVIIRRCGNLKCLPIELRPIINDIAYEYINSNIDIFFKIIDSELQNHTLIEDCFKKILYNRVSKFEKSFSSSLYQFPVIVFNLDGEIKLSDNIKLIPIDAINLELKELKNLNKTRVYESNFFLEIFVKTKCSRKLSLQIAEKCRDTTYNILKLLGTRISPQAVPLLTTSDRVKNSFHFYRYGPNKDNLFNASTYNMPHFQFHSKEFWSEFHLSHNIDGNLISTAFKIVELLLIPHFSNERVVERFERALLWYGDAVTEHILFQQVQKLVSSLEALVNFHEDNTTEVFKRRITNLNITKEGIDKSVRDKAKQLYDARSKIVHSSSLDETFDFCIINFCSETLLRAIYFFSIFGFEKTEFRKSLAKFIDEIPNRLQPKIESSNQ